VNNYIHLNWFIACFVVVVVVVVVVPPAAVINNNNNNNNNNNEPGTIEELLGRNSSGSGLESREYDRGDPLR
jgi:hypothetical protein